MNPKLNRRQFLGSALGSMAYFAAMASPLGLLRKAGAAGVTKRYLVNIQGMGGWDTHWFHHTFPAAQANFPASSTDPAYPGNLTMNLDYSGNVSNVQENYFHQRYPDGQLLQHPNRSDVYMGKGMRYVFGTNSDLLRNDISIWRGIQISDAHGVGNHIIQGGSGSSYAMSFSALIAQGIAAIDYPRALHYVQLTASPDAFNATSSMNTGYAVPVNLADYSAFNSLTAPNASDFSVSSQRDLINNSVSRLSAVSSNRLQMKTSQQVFSSFLSGFSAAAGLASTNVAQSNRFYYLWRTYTDAICNNVYGMYDASYKADLLPIFQNGTVYAAVNLDALTTKSNLDNVTNAGYDWTQSAPYSSYDDAKNSDLAGTTSPWITGFKTAIGWNDIYAFAWWQTILQASFSYAMAEFLIREDLAAVIDLPTPTSDAHDNTNDHLVRLTISFTAYKTLLTQLKSSGLLSNTTVALWTELDRTPNWALNIDSYNRGTGHNGTTSMLLAGYGVSGGKVFGDIMTGPGGAYNWVKSGNLWTHDFSNVTYSNALPVDPTTGQVSSSSSAMTINTRSVLPTMLSLFGLSVPQQQINDGIALPFVKS